MELAFNLHNFTIVLLIIMSNVLTYVFAANRTNNKIKESEDKIWEYIKLMNKTEPGNTSSGLTRKL